MLGNYHLHYYIENSLKVIKGSQILGGDNKFYLKEADEYPFYIKMNEGTLDKVDNCGKIFTLYLMKWKIHASGVNEKKL